MLLSIIEMGVGVQLDRGGLVVGVAAEVEVQLGSEGLVMEAAAEVDVRLGSVRLVVKKPSQIMTCSGCRENSLLKL